MLRTIICILSLLFYVQASLTQCPVISAYIENGKIYASWSGYVTSEVILFEWSVIEGEYNYEEQTCYSKPIFLELPNVLSWTAVRKASQVHSQSLTLNLNKSIYVVLRVTTADGDQVWVASNPLSVKSSTILVNPSAKKSKSSGTQPCTDCNEKEEKRPVFTTVREKLTEKFGPPIWPNKGAED